MYVWAKTSFKQGNGPSQGQADDHPSFLIKKWFPRPFMMVVENREEKKFAHTPSNNNIQSQPRKKQLASRESNYDLNHKVA
jgi:hypothetical protein